MEHPPQQVSGSVLRSPVVLVEVPQDCGAKQLYTLIIESLKFKITKGTIEDLRQRVYDLLKNCQVQMLVIDEADRIKAKTFADVRDIFDELKITVILVGTERLNNVINRDEQVKNRFCAYFHMGVLNSEQFEQTVAIWERDILQLPMPSNLTSKSTLKLLREKTRGYIGILDMILRKAAIVTLCKGKFKIDLETLKEVMAGYG
jgi:DNA transposition AAA+ family ATPase